MEENKKVYVYRTLEGVELSWEFEPNKKWGSSEDEIENMLLEDLEAHFLGVVKNFVEFADLLKRWDVKTYDEMADYEDHKKIWFDFVGN